jgi:UDP-N-acetylmuramoylalanine--D-glutamate ligase
VRVRIRALLQVLADDPAAAVKALVYGMARSGVAVADRLRERGDEVVAVDRALGNEDDLGLLRGVDVVVKSPGVPADALLVAAARSRGVPVWSEVELGWRLLPEGASVVGVTGTNGKTTTTELLGAIFSAAGRDVAVAGNVGTPLTTVRSAEWVVCELSSFQLEDVETLACDVAVLLNLEPDHLDRHGSFDAYRDAKLRIFERARVAVVPRSLALRQLLSTSNSYQVITVIEFEPTDALPAEPLIRGAHNRENAAAATAAARAAGIDDEAIAQALRTFAGVPHRLEPVGEIRGVRFVNDSKATNVAAARRALAAYADEPVHLILGGSLKGESFAPLAADLGSNVRSIHLVGEAASELAAALNGPPHDDDGTLDRAVEHAFAQAAAGDVVLLSPACASYDQYDNFEQRGEHFRRLVERLT